MASVLTPADIYRLIRKSSLFDARYYLAENPDVARAGIDPVLHYVKHGAMEGRRPSPSFDTAFYREQCTRLGIEVQNPVVHFLLEGRKLGLRTQSSPSLAQNPAPRASVAVPPDAARLLEAGLVDVEYYNSRYQLGLATAAEALNDYFAAGVKAGRSPSFYFDTAWYLEKNPDVAEAGVNPLLHYFLRGEQEGRAPSRYFDPAWYRRKNALREEECALAHFLARRKSFTVSPLPHFDAQYYARTYEDVRAAGIDPFEHYVLWGYKENRNPSDSFNTSYYSQRYLKQHPEEHPFFHYLAHLDDPAFEGAPPEQRRSLPYEIRRHTEPSRFFEERTALSPATPRRAKLLAYYLPQFHAIPENDQWWGLGFTEWTNIARGVPRFKGHYQPRVPRDLGFYSLDDPATYRRQVDFAQAAGVYGFVYYYYWFNGKRLLEKPIERMLETPDIRMPFALMWANENWTRRWDGQESEVLIWQDYDPAQDQALIDDFVRHFRDERYIRVGGRPLLMIYRPAVIPDTLSAVERWRARFRAVGEDPIFIAAQSFGLVDPVSLGFDGAIEFPPHKLANIPGINRDLEYLDDHYRGNAVSYDHVMERSLTEPPPAFPLIKTLVPSWDNDARRQGTGLAMVGATPPKYEKWLDSLVVRAREHRFFGEPFVCVNAWNEWCEAAYLEPDLHHGSAYLNATGRAVAGLFEAEPCDQKILLVGHDGFRAGAQELLFHIGRVLRSRHGVQVQYLLLRGGEMERLYRQVAPVHVLSQKESVEDRIAIFRERGYAAAIVNSVASASILGALKQSGVRTITLVHEMAALISANNLSSVARAAFETSDLVVFAANAVRRSVSQAAGIDCPKSRALILPQGLYKATAYSDDHRQAVRRELGIPDDACMALGVGNGDKRKGFDLFLKAWSKANRKRKAPIHFCWVGPIHLHLKQELKEAIDRATASGSFHLPGFRADVDRYYSAADQFLLTSREDPFPTVVHEALYAGLPVIAFAESGGMAEFLRSKKLGTVVPFEDVDAMVRELASGIGARPSDKDRAARRRVVERELDFGAYVGKLFSLALPECREVSVVVPSYNYARYLPERLGSIFSQTHPIKEILFLDDCSTDESVATARSLASEAGREMQVVVAQSNSGSVFQQWKNAVELAGSEFIWIAEADDSADPKFLATLVREMRKDPRIIVGFTDSVAVDSSGGILWPSHKPYFRELEGEALETTTVFDGREFLKSHLAVRNLLVNVSGMLWRREALMKALKACERELPSFRMAGDWRLYVEALGAPQSRICYVGDVLNVHRRHSTSITHALDADQHCSEIQKCHVAVRRKVRLSKAQQAGQDHYVRRVRQQLTSAAGNRRVAAKSARKGSGK